MSTVSEIFGAALSPEALSAKANTSAPADSPAPVETPQEVADAQPTAPMCELAGLVDRWFRDAANRRRSSGVEEKLTYALLAQTATYSPEVIERLKAGGTPQHLAEKLKAQATSDCTRRAKAMLIDLISQPGESLISMSASPYPDVPQDVAVEAYKQVAAELTAYFEQLKNANVEELPPEGFALVQRALDIATKGAYDEVANAKEAFARTRARRMEKRVWDMMLEGGFKEALVKYFDYICIYGTGVMIGPVPRAVARNVCRKEKGANVYKREYKTIPVYEAVNPVDCYPAPDAENTDDGPFCIRVKYSTEQFWRFATKAEDTAESGHWRKSAVLDILDRWPEGGLKLHFEPEDSTRREAENQGAENEAKDCTLEGIRCFASVRGKTLAEIGITLDLDGEPIGINNFYRVETIVMDGRVVYCRILDDRIGTPVSRGVFYELPGSWWGQSVADRLKMVQTIQDNVAIALAKNLAAASGSQIWINNAQRLVDKSEGAYKSMPYKVWSFSDSGFGVGGSQGAPMGVLTIPSTAPDLLRVWGEMRTQADIDSGIPAYTEGQTAGQGGALRTASGLAMYTEASTRGMKMVMTTTDNDVIMPVAQRTADWVLCYDDDMDLKGDVFVRPVGLIGRILKAQRDQARVQIFNVVVQSDYLRNAIGVKGVLALFRPSLQDVDINPDDVLPSEERMKFIETVEQLKALVAAQNPAPVPAPEEAAAPAPEVAAPEVAAPETPAPEGRVAERRAVA